MEQFLYYFFCKILGENEVINRNRKAISKELDIYIPSKAFAIEIGSWKWHRSIINIDRNKQSECAERGINLIIIYDGYNEEKDINSNNIWTFHNNLGEEKQYKTLKSICKKCLELINCYSIVSEKDWEEIAYKAILSSQRITHKEFLEQLKKRNKHSDRIVLLSDFKNIHDRISCKCSVCGKQWYPVAEDLLRGSWCPSCRSKSIGNKRSKKTQILEWRKINPNGSKLRCEKETGISRMTVYKWWDSNE